VEFNAFYVLVRQHVLSVCKKPLRHFVVMRGSDPKEVLVIGRVPSQRRSTKLRHIALDALDLGLVRVRYRFIDALEGLDLVHWDWFLVLPGLKSQPKLLEL
jgi:hypothetical protein